MQDQGAQKVALHCQLGRDVSARLRRYSDEQGMKIRAVVERALDEYLTARGYSPTDTTR